MNYSRILAAVVAASAINLPADAAVVVATDFQFGISPFTSTYSVLANDLLQTNLGSVQSIGNFTQETAGGLPALVNGALGTIDRSAAEGARNAMFATGGNTAGT